MQRNLHLHALQPDLYPLNLNNRSRMDVDMAAAAIAIDDEAVVIVSETDAAEAQSHSSSSSSSLGEDCACGEQRSSSTWLSSNAIHQQQRQHPYDDDSSDDNSDDTDIMKDESAAAGSNQNQDDLYCENMDDEDEAWVYQHMRGGSGGGSDRREDLMNALNPQQHSLRHHSSQNETEKNEHHHHAKKMRGYENESSTGPDTDVAGSAPLKSESNSDNPMDRDIEYKQHQQQYDHNQVTSKSNQSMQHQQHQQQLAHPSSALAHLKPRSSDAILSCPSCFNIVCMDCQQHEKYANQYRAMFVMNIGVDWNRKMVYDDAMGCLKLLNDETSDACNDADATITVGDEISADRRGEENIMAENYAEDNIHLQLGEGVNRGPDRIPEEHYETISTPKIDTGEEKSVEYDAFYSVHCSYCRYEVAALDMKDEIYYFFGCIASA